ncbi:unnamed protein product, partial [Prorocentrum cordatum]
SATCSWKMSLLGGQEGGPRAPAGRRGRALRRPHGRGRRRHAQRPDAGRAGPGAHGTGGHEQHDQRGHRGRLLAVRLRVRHAAVLPVSLWLRWLRRRVRPRPHRHRPAAQQPATAGRAQDGLPERRDRAAQEGDPGAEGEEV